MLFGELILSLSELSEFLKCLGNKSLLVVWPKLHIVNHSECNVTLYIHHAKG